MKFNIIVLSCLLLVGNVFASNIPGDFAKKKPCACGPLEHVFEVNAKNRYAHEYLVPKLAEETYKIINDKMVQIDQVAPNVKTVLQLLSQEISFRDNNGVLLTPRVNKKGETVLMLGDCEKYKQYKNSLAKPKIKNWLETMSHDVPSDEIYREFKIKLASI